MAVTRAAPFRLNCTWVTPTLSVAVPVTVVVAVAIVAPLGLEILIVGAVASVRVIVKLALLSVLLLSLVNTVMVFVPKFNGALKLKFATPVAFCLEPLLMMYSTSVRALLSFAVPVIATFALGVLKLLLGLVMVIMGAGSELRVMVMLALLT